MFDFLLKLLWDNAVLVVVLTFITQIIGWIFIRETKDNQS